MIIVLHFGAFINVNRQILNSETIKTQKIMGKVSVDDEVGKILGRAECLLRS
jgi:hypothetical protein